MSEYITPPRILIAFFTLFICFLVTVVVASKKRDNSLVADNYYAQDLDYQNRYEAVGRTPKSTVSIQRNLDLLSITISDKIAIKTGEIALYRPSSKASDQALSFTKNAISINTGTLAKGKWMVKITFTDLDNLSYYREEAIYL